ncbi:MAG: succinate dehydrogenase, partial [Terriglobia bacterium]
RWSNPLWRFYDWFLLALALVHGFNGVRVMVDDYVRRPGLRVFSLVVVWALTLVFLVAGTLVIVLFRVPAGG